MSTPDVSPRVVPPSRRRDKPIVSCSLCRRRKLKCDRQQPCRTCADRGLSLSCSYSRHPPGPSPEQPKTHVHDRIDQLERLVTTLMEAKNSENGGSSGPPTVDSQRPFSRDQSPDAEIPGNPDRVKLDHDTTSYTSSAHWTSILDGIAELKDQLEQIPTTPQPQNPILSEIPGPDLFLGRQRHATRREILSGIPSRPEADLLLDEYFANMHMAPTIIHKPTFLREYDRFWENPFETPIMWIGLLFSTFALATRFQHILSVEYQSTNHGDPNPEATSMIMARIDFYREKLVQCILLANYFKCPPYTIETFLQYFVTEYIRSQDSQFGTWMLAGMLVRMAFRMGYHREPSRFPNITPFRAEMRRRIWTMVVQTDLMTSTQVGLPRMIQTAMFDTREPLNLIDEDISEDMTELPSARPDTEGTTMLYALVRTRVLTVFARIMDVTSTSAQPAYRDIMELDTALREAYDNVPPPFGAICVRDFEHIVSEETMRRFYLGLNFLKGEIMLHRPFLLLGRTDSRYEYSRLACIDAALEILEFQKLMDTEVRPGGRLWSVKGRLWPVGWRISSLIAQDFLLATTVLCLDLDKELASPMVHSTDDFTHRVRFKRGQPTRVEIIEALASSYNIWVRASDRSREAQKVAAAVSLVLGKANSSVQYPTVNPIPASIQDDLVNFTQHYDQNFTSEIPAFISIDNPQYYIPFPENDTAMEFGGSFNWDGFEADFAMPNLDQPFLHFGRHNMS